MAYVASLFWCLLFHLQLLLTLFPLPSFFAIHLHNLTSSIHPLYHLLDTSFLVSSSSLATCLYDMTSSIHPFFSYNILSFSFYPISLSPSPFVSYKVQHPPIFPSRLLSYLSLSPSANSHHTSSSIHTLPLLVPFISSSLPHRNTWRRIANRVSTCFMLWPPWNTCANSPFPLTFLPCDLQYMTGAWSIDVRC